MSPVFDLADPESAGIAYSSYDFEYLTPHHRVDRLLKQYRLDEVIAAGETDLEKFALLRAGAEGRGARGRRRDGDTQLLALADPHGRRGMDAGSGATELVTARRGERTAGVWRDHPATFAAVALTTRHTPRLSGSVPSHPSQNMRYRGACPST